MRKRYLLFAAMGLLIGVSAMAQTSAEWPKTTDFTGEAHFWSADGFLFDSIPSGTGNMFFESLTILSGGDQVADDATVAGLSAKKSNSMYFNVADEYYDILPSWPVIDVLVLYFANSESKRSNLNFLLGTLPGKYLHTVGDFSFESVSDQYEWRLFRVDNSGAWAGHVYDDSEGAKTFGGVNGGTIRFGYTNGLIIRAVAFGPQGLFGEPEDINVSQVVEFNPDDYPIMAEWDLNNGVKNGLDVYRATGGDQEIVESSDIGPTGDKRKAIRPAWENGADATQDLYVNWEILNEYFGPTSQPSTKVKIVAEYYDDPALAGTLFGPEAYITAGDAIAFFPETSRTTLAGTGKWMEVEWYVPDVKFKGVNVPTQAAARFAFGGPVYISRLRMGVIRTTGKYAGVDPIPGVYPFDPDPYGIYAELDLNTGLEDNLALGNSGGDQEYIVEYDIGPANDKRTAVRPSLDLGTDPFDSFINFAIQNEVFGPSNQPNAVFKVAVDYYDDPALTGAVFGPEVYQSSVAGVLTFKFVPTVARVTLEGTDAWKVVAWQINDMNFTGVNQGPQAAARFAFSTTGAVHISRVRYAVIRPKGKNAGVDMLSDLTPYTDVSSWDLY